MSGLPSMSGDLGRLRVPGALLAVSSAVLLALAGLLFADAARAQSDTYSESRVKAAFIYNFFKFIELPEAPSGDVRLCVVASDERSQALREVNGKGLAHGTLLVHEVRAESLSEDDLACDALFVGAMDRRTTEQIVARASGRKILTIGEDGAFLKAGGAINLYVETGKVRFEVDLANAERTGAKISSKLLKLGKVHDSRTQVGAP